MGSNVRPKGRGECLAEQDIPILRPLALVDENLAILKVDLGNLDPAQLRNPDAGVEDQPQHDGVLDIFGPIYNLVETAELVGVQHAGELDWFLVGPKFA
jgi:hypothetical protein